MGIIKEIGGTSSARPYSPRVIVAESSSEAVAATKAPMANQPKAISKKMFSKEEVAGCSSCFTWRERATGSSRGRGRGPRIRKGFAHTGEGPRSLRRAAGHVKGRERTQVKMGAKCRWEAAFPVARAAPPRTLALRVQQ